MSLIKCPECGKEISLTEKSCPNCGCPINNTGNSNQSETNCKECGAPIPPNAKACPNCGCPASIANAPFATSSLLPNEYILCSAQWHSVNYLLPILFSIVALLFIVLWLRGLEELEDVLAWGVYFPLLLVHVLLSIYGFISIKHNEFVVTTRRVLVKNGIIMRASYELRLDKLESIQVYQGILGRVLGYGHILVHGIGASRRLVMRLEQPLEFRQHIFAELYKINNEKSE